MDKPKTLPEWVCLYNELQQSVEEQIAAVVEYLNGYGIQKLGLWSNDFVEGCESTPEYTPEDKVVFEGLIPEFGHDLTYYVENMYDPYSCDGRYVGVSVEKSDDNGNGECSLQVIYISDTVRKSGSQSASDLDVEKRWNICEAIVKSIEFNKANNIPVDKWSVMHHPNIEPYTLEYIADSDFLRTM